jgi:hypothetical protein
MNNAQSHLLLVALYALSQVLEQVRPAQLLIASHMPQRSEQWIRTKF